jgi:uncharacterized protein (UPF0248 family)
MNKAKNDQSKSSIYVLDRYTNKNIKVINIDENSLQELKP